MSADNPPLADSRPIESDADCAVQRSAQTVGVTASEHVWGATPRRTAAYCVMQRTMGDLS